MTGRDCKDCKHCKGIRGFMAECQATWINENEELLFVIRDGETTRSHARVCEGYEGKEAEDDTRTGD